MIPQVFDLPFFLLLFGVGISSTCAELTLKSWPEDLPFWASKSIGELILTLMILPCAFSELILYVYGFLILPWYTVLITGRADLLVGGMFHGLFVMPVVRRFGVFVAFAGFYIIAILTVVLYFGNVDCAT